MNLSFIAITGLLTPVRILRYSYVYAGSWAEGVQYGAIEERTV